MPGKPKGRPKSSDRNDVTVKVDREVISKAKFVADLRGTSLAEYLTETLRAHVDRDFGKAVQQVKPTEGKG